MSLFMFCLTENSGAAEYERVLEALEKAFPDQEFERVWEWQPAINNTIFPVMSEPHASRPGGFVASNVAPTTIAAVKDGYGKILDRFYPKPS